MKQATKKNKKSPNPKDVPPGVLAFLGEDNLHLFKRDDVGAVLPQRRPRSDSKKKKNT